MGTSVGASDADTARMVTELVRLHAALQETVLPLDTEGSAAVRQARTEMIAQLQDYVIPRMMTVDAPLLAVVGGSTGAGKSTLVNSIVGEKVTTPGLLRPTTRTPVLVHHPDDAAWFGQDRLLPELTRIDHSSDSTDALQLVASTNIRPGLAILDAPDVDSVEAENRRLAAELLAAGDLWLFVTSSARYADQVPWEFLKAAAERATSVAVVLDRTPVEAVQTVATHLARMLAARGLKDSPLFIVNEGVPSEEGLLPASYVAEVRAWLDLLAADAAARHEVVTQTLDGAVRALTFNVHKIADAAAAQMGAAEELRAAADSGYAEAAAAVRAGLADGSLLHGEVEARWREFAGSGDLVKALEDRTGLRDKLKGRPGQADELAHAVAAGVELFVLDHAERAAARTAQAWSSSPAGAALVGDLGRASRGLRARAEKAVSGWQDDIDAIVRGADQRSSATFLSYGPAGIGAAVMVCVLAGQAPEAGLARRLLAVAYGDGKADQVVGRARAELVEKVTTLLEEEQARFTTVLAGLAPDPDAPGRLRQAARRVDDVRWATQR